MKSLVFLFALPVLGAIPALATEAFVQTTATQAILVFPGTLACDLVVRDDLGQLVPDVDGTLFLGSGLVGGRGTSSGGMQTIVVGKRAAELATNGLFVSRALQANTLHSYSICSGAITGTFSTKNPPVGQTYSEGIPVDPNNPGQSAWPTFSWTDRTQRIVDPQTGFLLKLLDFPEDAFNNLAYVNTFTTASGTNWVNPTNILVDDSSVATITAAQDPLFVPTNLTGFASELPSNPSLTLLNPFFNAWADVSSNIEVALTVDDHTPVGDWITHAVAACTPTASCLGAGNRFSLFASPITMLADWFFSTHGVSTVDLSMFMARTGGVTRVGTTVTLIGGDPFCLCWTSGTHITINSVGYTIASVNHDASITLTSGAGSDVGTVGYSVSAAGFLVRNKTTVGTITIQFMKTETKITPSAVMESGGDFDIYSNCSPVLTQFSGEDGIHCLNGNVVRWIGLKTLTVNRLGNTVPQLNLSPPGWQAGACRGAYWDQVDPNSYYCTVYDFSFETQILKFTYTGSNADIGDQYAGTPVTYCGSPPCWTVTSKTSSSLESMAAAFDPRWNAAGFSVAGYQTDLTGHMAGTNALIYTMRWAGQDSGCFVVKFDLATGTIVGSIPGWGSWPLRWSTCHGVSNVADPNYVIYPGTFFKGPLTGTTDGPGHGPYVAKISGAVSSTPGTCPAAPVPVPVQVRVWPTGSHCSTFVLDGEPGDPTPFQDSVGTITTTGGSVVGSGTNFTKFSVGHQMKIAGSYYIILTWTDATHLTLNGSPGAAPGTAYTLFYENVNSSLLPNSDYAFLTTLGVGDLFYMSQPNFVIDCNGGNAYFGSGGCEVARILSIVGSGPGMTIVVQRAIGPGGTYTSLASIAAGATFVTLPGGCTMAITSPCVQTFVDWDTRDPFGQNVLGTTLISDTGDKGCCHGTFQNLRVDVGLVCASQDGQSGCYFARPAPIPAVYTAPGGYVSWSPLFHGLAGVGYANSVDSHPSHSQFKAVSGTSPYFWIGDGRPFLGDDVGNLFGSFVSPGIATGQRYKFLASQVNRLRPRVLPSFAMCGYQPLLDVSGPSSSLGTTSADNYKYIYIVRAGEGVTGSLPGEVYVNCPQMRYAFSSYPGIGQDAPDVRDMTVADMSMYTHADVQVGVQSSDASGVRGRVVTKIGRYKPYTFMNNKISPDGGLMFKWATALNGVRTAIVVARLPPWPGGDSKIRNDLQPLVVTIPVVAGVDNAIVRFGYDTSFNCTPRQDPCVANASSIPTGLVPFAYASESPNGLACSNGCTIQVPVIPQRIVYSQVFLRNASNVVLKTYPMNINASN